MTDSDLLLTAGVDEAGRGCLAGPVVAGAVILPEAYDLPYLTDSKKLSAARRETLAPAIKAQAVAWAVGMAWPAEIDRINILQATFAAMARAVRALSRHPAALVIDGNKCIPAAHLAILSAAPRQKAVVGGDASVPAVSAASILAKTSRDKLMTVFERRYPGYGFAAHKGYGAAAHLAALTRLGPCPIHRLTFRGVLPETSRQLGLPGL
ncbi:ribonuclease HII [Solidesulfovibrio sp.]|uniref:ribonuclease HII n=1 Tax=Solidesulfovibrio sp. TaxID=2910990 RepID=UPI000EEB6DD9|nr:ribonuclease HII [Solidesulfovibrio sp.]MEA5089580.1 ribonuclease HII [Solidesulfovibrio sp.]HCR12103.1 ribonuclease HII [Desulfovibrio sp.]HML61380.1 ribonuclease HII [Solidesulfovibrio sp.]